MNKKMTLLALLGMCVLAASPVYAHEAGEGYGHGMKGHHGQNPCPVATKVERTSHFLLEKKADLNLTDDQVKSIKDIQLQTEKSSAQQMADMKIFMLDLQSKLGDDKIDAEGTKALIDKNFAAFATDAKASVDAYAKLQSVLTPDQAAKVKEIWKSKKEEWKNKGEFSHKDKE